MMYNIVPMPQKILIYEKKCSLSFPLHLNFNDIYILNEKVILDVCNGAFISSEKSDISFISKSDTTFEYKIIADENLITVTYKSESGLFHALVTLWQIFKNEKELKCFEIEDFPDIENRGFMLDISRGKIPKTETLKHLINILSRFKFNQLQFYIEGFSFMYPSFKKYCDSNSSLTVEEIKEINSYCEKRFIELVPNQNSLGHMALGYQKMNFLILQNVKVVFHIKDLLCRLQL